MRSKINKIIYESIKPVDFKMSRTEIDSLYKSLPILVFVPQTGGRIQSKILPVPILDVYIEKISQLIDNNSFKTIYTKNSKNIFSPILEDIHIRMLFFQLIYLLKRVTIRGSTAIKQSIGSYEKWFNGGGARTANDLYRILLGLFPKKYWKYFDLTDIDNMLILLSNYLFFFNHLCPDAGGRVNGIYLPNSEYSQLTSYTGRLVNLSKDQITDKKWEEIQEAFLSIIKSRTIFDTKAIGDISSVSSFDQYRQTLDMEKIQAIFNVGKFSKESYTIHKVEAGCYQQGGSVWNGARKVKSDLIRSLAHPTYGTFESITSEIIDKYITEVENNCKKYQLKDTYEKKKTNSEK